MTVSENSGDLYHEVKTMIQSKSVDGFILLYSLKDDPIEHLLNEFKSSLSYSWEIFELRKYNTY